MSNDAKDTDPFMENDAAYVMGSLTPEDRRAFEAHLVDCAECTQSVAELSTVTDLLDKVPLARVLQPAPDTQAPPDLMLPMLIRAVRAQRRRRAIWMAASGAVAASLVALAVVIGVTQSGSPETTGTSMAMTHVRPSAVEATYQLSPTAWGTRVALDCRWTGAKTASSVKKVYRMVAVPRNGGAPQVLAQWAIWPGQDVKVVGSTDLAASGIAAIELRAVAGDTVLLRGQPNA
jgi:hypothetical protein